MKGIFGILAAGIAVFAYIPYIREIIRGDSKPKQTTWLISTTIDFMYTVSAVVEDGAVILFFAIYSKPSFIDYLKKGN